MSPKSHGVAFCRLERSVVRETTIEHVARVHKYRCILPEKQGKNKAGAVRGWYNRNHMRVAGRFRLILISVGALVCLIGLSPAGASSANISHSYHATTAVQEGSILSLDPDKTDFVQLANVTNGSQLLGVAVNSDDSLIAVDAGESTVQVATSGTASALVSTVNGDIKVGDQIAVSAFNGIGMKAKSGSHVIGLAQTDFNSGSAGTTRQVTNEAGVSKDIRVGYVRLAISITVNNTSSGVPQPNALQKLAKSLTGHQVSTLRIVLSIVIAIVALIALISLIYGAIYGSIISIGRNPLAKHAVFRSLGSVLVMIVLTAGIAAASIYFLLR